VIKTFFSALFRRYLAPAEFSSSGGYGEVWRIAWPLIAVNASNVLMLLTNRAFLARHQLEDVTAAVPAGQLFFTLQVFFLVTCSFIGPLVAQNFGKKDYAACVRSTWNGFYFSCIVGLILIPVLPWIGGHLLEYGKLSESIRCRQLDYFNTLAPCAALSCMEAPFYAYFTAIGRTKLVGAVKIASSLLGLPLNYILIFGKCGSPEFGITGAAMAAAGTCLLSTVSITILFITQRDARFEVWKHLQFRRDIIVKLITFGTPGGFQALARNSCFAFVILMFSSLGDQAMAAASLAMTINHLSFIPLMGLCEATSILTGKYIGERRVEVATMIPFRAIRLLMLYFGAIAMIYLFAPDRLLRLFQSDASTALDFSLVAENVKIILLVQIVQNVFDGIRFVIMGSLRGAGDTRVPLLLVLLTNGLVQIPGTLIAVHLLQLPIWAAWIGSITVYVFVDAMVILWRRQSGAWQKIRLIELDNAPAS